MCNEWRILRFYTYIECLKFNRKILYSREFVYTVLVFKIRKKLRDFLCNKQNSKRV